MKMRLDIGRSSFEFEGSSEEFEKHGFEFATKVLSTPSPGSSGPETPASAPDLSAQDGSIAMTAKAAATILAADSGPELLYAAAAYLAVVEQNETFTRTAVHEVMKTAVGFYKPTYSGNLTKYVDGLCKKGILIEVGNNNYAVKAQALAEMKSKLLK